MATSQKRQRQLERARYERLQKRREQAQQKARRRNALTAVGVVVVLAIAATLFLTLGGNKKHSANTAATSSPQATITPSTTPATTAKVCPAPPSTQPKKMSWAKEPAMTISTSKTYTATFATNCGNIVIQLDAAKAPHAVNSFVFLASQHYFDATKCHRLTTSGIYVLQCGDPTGTGSGGPGYQFKDENLAGATYPAGTVAMANSGANTNGSQFFLVYKDTSLPPNYTPFGKITSGLDILNKIAGAGSDNANGTGDGHPLQSVMLEHVTAG